MGIGLITHENNRPPNAKVAFGDHSSCQTIMAMLPAVRITQHTTPAQLKRRCLRLLQCTRIAAIGSSYLCNTKWLQDRKLRFLLLSRPASTTEQLSE